MTAEQERRTIMTRFKAYNLPLCASRPIEDLCVGIDLPDKFKGGKIWQTPDGEVFTSAPEKRAVPAELPPLGPVGRSGSSQHAKIYTHNRKVAARRQKTEALIAEGVVPEGARSELPPLGPTGRGYRSQRAKMYAHNRNVAARRLKAERVDPDQA